MSGQARLLVVDDEPSLQDIVATSMRFLGYQVAVAATGREAVRMASDMHPDLIILDVMLPDFDGLEVMKRVRSAGRRRRRGVPVRPGHPDGQDRRPDRRRRRLRHQAVRPGGTRRPGGRRAAPDPAGDRRRRACCGWPTCELDPETYQVTRAGVPIELAPTEYKMLRHLMINANVVLSRQQLLDAVWGTDFYGDDSVVATYISYLRRKVDATGEPLIHTHRGFGYVLRGQRH